MISSLIPQSDRWYTLLRIAIDAALFMSILGALFWIQSLRTKNQGWKDDCAILEKACKNWAVLSLIIATGIMLLKHFGIVA